MIQIVKCGGMTGIITSICSTKITIDLLEIFEALIFIFFVYFDVSQFFYLWISLNENLIQFLEFTAPSSVESHDFFLDMWLFSAAKKVSSL